MEKINIEKLKVLSGYLKRNRDLFDAYSNLIGNFELIISSILNIEEHKLFEYAKIYNEFSDDKMWTLKGILPIIDGEYEKEIMAILKNCFYLCKNTSLSPTSRIEVIGKLQTNSYYPEQIVQEIIDDIEHFIEQKKFNYYSVDFRKLRLKVFLRDGEICAKCGEIPKEGVSLTVDHIKPVSKFPELAMDEGNLQVLCWECNQKKSNIDFTDYRQK